MEITPANLPDSFGQIIDVIGTQELVAEEFVRQLGISDKIPDPLALSTSAVFGSNDSHPTHWIAVIRVAGLEVGDPDSLGILNDPNGYSVLFCPKRVGPENLLLDVIEEYLTKMGIPHRFIGSVDSDAP